MKDAEEQDGADLPEAKNGKAPPVRVREMEIDDLAPVFHLGERLFRSKEFPNLYRTWDDWEVLDLYQGEPESCLVAELGDEVIGFVLGSSVTKRRSAWKYGYLVWMGVAEEHRRRGIAERLFRAYRERMLREGVRILLVDTESDNTPALRFFARVGFGHARAHTYLTLNLDHQRARSPGGDGPTAGKDRRHDG